MDDVAKRFLHLRVGLGAVLIGVYALSLVLVAAYFEPGGEDPSWPGYAFFTCGWMGPYNSTPFFAWFGNPLGALGVLLMTLGRRPALGRISAALFFVGLIVALDSLRLRGAGLSPNEGGVETLHFHSFGPGFYVWLLSYVLGFVFALIVARQAALVRSASPPP